MKIGLLGLIMSYFSDVNYDKLRFALTSVFTASARI